MTCRWGFLSVAFAALIVLGAASASAQTGGAENKAYVTGKIGWSLNRNSGDQRIVFEDASFAQTTGGIDVSNTAAFELGGGYRLGSFRADLAGSYSTPADLSATTTANSRLDSKVTTYAAFANLYYDLPKIWRLNFFAGGGVGFAVNDLDDITLTPAAGAASTLSGDTSTDLAWRLVWGLHHRLSDNALIEMSHAYTDYGTAESGTTGNPGPNAVNAAKIDVRAHVISLGLRYEF